MGCVPKVCFASEACLAIPTISLCHDVLSCFLKQGLYRPLASAWEKHQAQTFLFWNGLPRHVRQNNNAVVFPPTVGHAGAIVWLLHVRFQGRTWVGTACEPHTGHLLVPLGIHEFVGSSGIHSCRPSHSKSPVAPFTPALSTPLCLKRCHTSATPERSKKRIALSLLRHPVCIPQAALMVYINQTPRIFFFASHGTFSDPPPPPSQAPKADPQVTHSRSGANIRCSSHPSDSLELLSQIHDVSLHPFFPGPFSSLDGVVHFVSVPFVYRP